MLIIVGITLCTANLQAGKWNYFKKSASADACSQTGYVAFDMETAYSTCVQGLDCPCMGYIICINVKG